MKAPGSPAVGTLEPCVVVGAGLAGSAAAVLLARHGLQPLVLERTATPQPRICGEFISTEAVAALAALGVDVHALGGQRTRRLRLACGALRIEAELPFEAVGLSRHTLDGALQQAAVDAGARLQRGQRATIAQLADGSAPYALRLSDGSLLHTPTLMLACGKTDLAPLQRQPVRRPEPLVGWQLHLRLQPAQRAALQGCVEVALFDGGYAGLQAVEGDRVNLCLLAHRSPATPGLQALLQALQQSCPLLAERLEGARWLDPAPQSIYRVPYGHLFRPTPQDPPGLWRLGDQAVVIPSFTGDGMAIALHSAALAAHGLLQGDTAQHYHRQLLHDVGPQVRRAHALYRAGQTRPGRSALLALLRRWPSLLGWIAAMTRVPAAVLRW
jgi:flavin-dependent dehydrogenase